MQDNQDEGKEQDEQTLLKDEQEMLRKKAAMRALCVANGAFMTATMMILPARAPMVLEICNGDAQAAAKTLGFMSSCGAVLEVLLNPVFGRLSDKYGRKPFLLVAPFVRAVLHALAGLLPNSIAIQYIDRIVTSAMVFIFQAPVNAALTDLFADKDLAVAMSRNQTFFGLGCAVGPLIGSRLGGAKAFFGSAGVFAATGMYIASQFPETLALDHRKEFDVAACNPFRFLKLFFHGKQMAALASTIALQSFGDYPNIYDFNFLYLKSVFNWQQAQVGSFATAVGITQILGGEVTGQIIHKFGQSGATAVCNLAWIFSMGLLGTSRSVPQLAAALFFMTFGHLRSTPVDATLQRAGQASGMGRAEIISAKMNLTAIIKILAPILYGNVFAWATTKGRTMPGMPYFLICFLTAVSQTSFWSQASMTISQGQVAYQGRRHTVVGIPPQSGPKTG